MSTDTPVYVRNVHDIRRNLFGRRVVSCLVHVRETGIKVAIPDATELTIEVGTNAVSGASFLALRREGRQMLRLYDVVLTGIPSATDPEQTYVINGTSNGDPVIVQLCTEPRGPQ